MMKRLVIISALAVTGLLTACSGYGETQINPYASLDWLTCVNAYVESNYTMAPVPEWSSAESAGAALIAACGQPLPAGEENLQP